MLNEDMICGNKGKCLNIEIFAHDRKNLVLDITNKMKENNINILSLRTEFINEFDVRICMIIENVKLDDLEKLLYELKNISHLFDLNMKKYDKSLLTYNT